jgi:hypothetical protein
MPRSYLVLASVPALAVDVAARCPVSRQLLQISLGKVSAEQSSFRRLVEQLAQARASGHRIPDDNARSFMRPRARSLARHALGEPGPKLVGRGSDHGEPMLHLFASHTERVRHIIQVDRRVLLQVIHQGTCHGAQPVG